MSNIAEPKILIEGETKPLVVCLLRASAFRLVHFVIGKNAGGIHYEYKDSGQGVCS